jgi:hypothetical protein
VSRIFTIVVSRNSKFLFERPFFNGAGIAYALRRNLRTRDTKMKISWIRRGIFIALSAVGSAAFGFAFSGPNPDTQPLTWNGFSNGSVAVSTSSGTFLAGQFQGFFDGEGNGLGPDDFFRFFCVDVSHLAVAGPTSYTRILGLDGSHDATDFAELTRLFNMYYPHAATGTYYSGGAQTNFGDFGAGPTSAQDSAAFQLAVWEIWFDNNMDLSSGTFTAAPSAVTTQAQGYLTAVGNSSVPAAGWTLFEFESNNGSHNYISVEHSGPLQQAPEPGMLVLIGVGALAAWSTSKRQRKAA